MIDHYIIYILLIDMYEISVVFFNFWDLARSCQQCPSKLPDGDETVET